MAIGRMRRTLPLSLVTGAVLGGGFLGCASQPKGTPAGLQLRFGVEMAQRGLWREAAFRFEQARDLEIGNAAVWNNLAVAYEALGRFEDARQAYQRALELDPSNRALRRNYTRFIEFYQAFRPRPKDVPLRPPETGGNR